MSELHPVIAAAARGELPEWARMSEDRLAHAARVATLLEGWAEELGMLQVDRDRWVAAGWLHDSLKDEKTKRLRKMIHVDRRDIPDPVLHGPAAAARLEEDGVEDWELLNAVAWHTLGHPVLGRMGMAVYCADFLEPGRDVKNEWRARRRDRMPEGLETVTRDIVKVRVKHLLKKNRPVRPETMAFWNRLSVGDSWARASEV